MEIAWISSTLCSQGQVHGVSLIFLHLPQYKLQNPKSQLWQEVVNKHCLHHITVSDENL